MKDRFVQRPRFIQGTGERWYWRDCRNHYWRRRKESLQLHKCEDDLTHNAPVDDLFSSWNHDSCYNNDHWKRLGDWERPPTGITWDMYVDPCTGDTFARGDCVIIEPNCVFSQYNLHENDVGVGDTCVLLEFWYEPNRNFRDIQKQYFILYSYNEEHRKKSLL